jgi:hypothetical protein
MTGNLLRSAALFFLLFDSLYCFSQSTIFSENIGSPSGTTAISSYTGWQNNGTLTFSSGGIATPAVVSNALVSNNAGASGAGNILLDGSLGVSHGFSIESINAQTYQSMTLQFNYFSSLLNISNLSVDYWDGSAWQSLTVTLTGGLVSWQASPTISLPVAAQINGLKIRFVQTGLLQTRIDDIVLKGTPTFPPAITVQPSAMLSCTGAAATNSTVTATGTSLTYQWQVSTDNGATFTNISGSDPSYSGSTSSTLIINVTIAMDGYQYRVVVSGLSFYSSVTSNAATLTINYTWTGATSTNWGTTSNWSCNIVPNTSTAIVNIPNTTNKPIVSSGTYNLKNIIIASGATVTNNSSLQIWGTITNNGVFTSTSGTIGYNGTSAQSIAANTFYQNTLKGLTITNAAGVTLGGPLTITDVFAFGSVNNSTFNTGDYLILHSDLGTLSTARIADITNGGSNSGNSISGKVTVEHYMTSYNNRGYRLITPSVNTSTSIHANWQEGATWRFDNPKPGYGTHITGTLTDQTNGLDATQTGQPSLYVLQNNSAWVTVWNTSSTTLSAKTGYLLFVRGDRTYDLDQPQPIAPTNNTSLNTVIEAKGTVLQGTQTFTGLVSGLDGSGNPVSGNESLVTNPYPAPLSWSNIWTGTNAGNFENYYIYWDPNISTNGGYVAVTTTGITAPATNATNEIQSGLAFFLTTKPGVSTPTFTVREQDKSTNNNIDVFAPTSQQAILNSSLYYFDYEHGNMRIADGAVAVFGNYSAGIDGNDALQMSNTYEDIAFLRGGKKLAIETRPVITGMDTLFIFTTRMKTQGYEWRMNTDGMFDPMLTAVLVDRYTGSRSAIDLVNPTIISFNCDVSIPASVATNRFYIVFNQPAGLLPITFKSVKAYEYNRGVKVDWILNAVDADRYEVERSVTGADFTKTASIQSSRNGNSETGYSWFDIAPNKGVNFYRIKVIDKAGQISYSKVVMVTLGRTAPGIAVYPNPVTSTTVTYVLQNVKRGTYPVTITNKLGQVIYSAALNYQENNRQQEIHLAKSTPAGTYRLKVGNYTTTLVKE